METETAVVDMEILDLCFELPEEVPKSTPPRYPSMKRQKPPASLSVGSILYRYDAYTYDDGSRTVDAEEWVVRSIRAKRNSISRWGVKASRFNDQRKMINITHRINDITWSKKTGWEKSISLFHRKQFPLGEELPNGFYTTPLQALKYSIQSKECDLSNCVQWKGEEESAEAAAEWEEDIENHAMELRLLKGSLTKLRKLKSK